MNNKIYVLMKTQCEIEHSGYAVGHYASLEAAKEALLKAYQKAKDWYGQKLEDDCRWIASSPDPVWVEREHWYDSRETDRVWELSNTWTFHDPLYPENRAEDSLEMWIESVDLL